ncbi:hypothetical protein M5X00_29910 [Paenibacillus alvei]|nr:hypothetical protein [Paenibacillus alvei]EJW14438.1 hypothetical protein PAV_13c00570 [Paenibacillus alvei DSM 29]MCY9708198.1 hypothetical protein [Paenibacillus alvei]MCY9737906.1 hypothetical protein [Paenibacillus alvei]MCY9758438.1 hypothetical protein [Paenibacillus alvei]MEC0080226.1 hypothetical protein [Paenibacillus alvei]
MPETTQQPTRDWEDDWNICKQASEGPWKWEDGNKEYSEYGKITDSDGFSVCWFGNYTTYYPIAGEEPEEKDIQFMTNSRVALPYWLQQYQKKDEMYKELARFIAKKNCDYYSLKFKFLRMRKECEAEKQRADEA